LEGNWVNPWLLFAPGEKKQEACAGNEIPAEKGSLSTLERDHTGVFVEGEIRGDIVWDCFNPPRQAVPSFSETESLLEFSSRNNICVA
jgi:hypothetical protein